MTAPMPLALDRPVPLPLPLWIRLAAAAEVVRLTPEELLALILDEALPDPEDRDWEEHPEDDVAAEVPAVR